MNFSQRYVFKWVREESDIVSLVYDGILLSCIRNFFNVLSE